MQAILFIDHEQFVDAWMIGEEPVRTADRITFAVGADPDRIRWAIDVARTSRREAGLDPDGLELGAYLPLVVHADRSRARALVAGGPWSPSLTANIPAGASSVTVYYEDPTVGSPSLSAAAGPAWDAGSQSIVVASCALPTCSDWGSRRRASPAYALSWCSAG